VAFAQLTSLTAVGTWMIGDVVKIDGFEFEVVFDGSHHGQDLDLLDAAARVPIKRGSPDPPRRQNAARDVILGLLRTGGRFTQNELCDRTGLPMGTVNSIIYDLRRTASKPPRPGELTFRDAGRVSPIGQKREAASS
jgi:hypothetical protein